jgi:lipopolysaccharide/colanic/teichoic acid biosynthesis glycosyltransferase/glycosyltransferase involved in cell wall biosynthesis
MRPQRVLLVITKGDLGGAQTHVVELCRFLWREVHFTAVIGGEPGSLLEQRLQALGVETVSAWRLKNSLNPVHVLAAVLELLRVIRRNRPDVIHAHSSVAGVVSRMAARWLGLPVVYTVHGFGFKPETRLLARWHAWLAETALAAWTTRMVCVSRHEQQWAEQLPMDPGRVCVIPNVLADDDERSQAQANPRVVMVARMAPPKRHDHLLLALAMLAERGMRPPTTLLGSGPQERTLKQMAAAQALDHVVFSGDRNDVSKVLAEHSIFVLASDHEGMPLSVIEAMRAGMAIVASRLPGIEELVEHEHSALLVKPNPIALAEALLRLIQDPELQQRLGREARRRYEQNNQPRCAAAAMLEVYEEVPLIPNSAWPFTWTRRQAQGIGAERPHSPHVQLAWTAAGTLVFALAWLISDWLVSQQVVTYVFSQTVLAGLIPYSVACHLAYRGTRLPAAEQAGLILVTTIVPFALMPLLFALAQAPYSRGALLLCCLLTAAWFSITWRWIRPSRPPQLICWHETDRTALHTELQKVGIGAHTPDGHETLGLLKWPRHWHGAPERVPKRLAVHGALHTPPAPGSGGADHEISRLLKLRNVRLYSPAAVAEALSGRIPSSLLADEAWQAEGDAAYDLVKRAFDTVLVLLTLPFWLPLALVMALAVRLDSEGPILFSQWRVGLDGQPFVLRKFRSMRHESSGDDAQFAEMDDERVTRWGRIMRRTRLDELPQLWNVLVGDMSLIGPRPEQLGFVEQFAREIPSYPYRHLVRPGLTGWAQVHQGYAAGPAEAAVKLSYDLYYVAHYSLAMDLLILGKTIATVISGKGAR